MHADVAQVSMQHEVGRQDVGHVAGRSLAAPPEEDGDARDAGADRPEHHGLNVPSQVPRIQVRRVPTPRRQGVAEPRLLAAPPRRSLHTPLQVSASAIHAADPLVEPVGQARHRATQRVESTTVMAT